VEATPEIIMDITGADKVLMPRGFFFRDRLASLIQMLEN